MIVLEEAKQLLCNGCGSKLGVIASDIQDGGQPSSEEIGVRKIRRKYYICPSCKHYNYLEDEEVPTRSARYMNDLNAYNGDSKSD